MSIINHYSMLWGGIIILGLMALYLWKRGFKPIDGVRLLILAAGLAGAWLLLRPTPASTTALEQFQAELGQGQAVLLEMQSPY